MLSERVAADLKAALRAKDEVVVRTLRMLRTEIRYREDQLRRPLRPEDEAACVRAAIQRRTDAATQYRSAGREDLATAEEQEREVLKRYLPPQMDAAGLEAVIESVIAELEAKGPRDFGRVMKEVMARVAGQAEGSVVSAAVRERLSSMS